jgi:hypothetical protein
MRKAQYPLCLVVLSLAAVGVNLVFLATLQLRDIAPQAPCEMWRGSFPDVDHHGRFPDSSELFFADGEINEAELEKWVDLQLSPYETK